MFLNVAAAVAAVIRFEGELLLTIRANQPAQGKLDFAGGFVDPGENLEAALIRELQEELSITVSKPTYLGSYSNTYPYRGITYKTADAFFLIDLNQPPNIKKNDEIQALKWLKLEDIEAHQLAFDSGRAILKQLRAMEDQDANTIDISP